MSLEVPSGWRTVDLADVAKESRVRNSDLHISEERLVGVFKDQGMVPMRDRVRGASVERCKVVEPGDFAYNPMRINIGSIARSTADANVMVSPDYVVFSPDPEKVDGLFLDYLRQSDAWAAFVGNAGDGGVRIRIYFEHLARFRFNLPPLHEQRRIAEILSSVDEAIAATRAVIEQTRKVKQSVLERLLTKGIDNTRFKQTEIGEIPEGWRVGRLDNFFVLQRGFDLPVQSRTPGDVPIIASNGEIAKHSERRVGGPAVITGRSGTLGKVFFYPMACWPLNTTLYVKDFKSNNAEFVYYFLQYFDVARFGTGTGVPTLNRNDVHSQVVAFPPAEEQPDIVSVLRAFDENLDAEHTQLHQLKELKSALMSDVLTGRKRVTDALPMAAE